MKQHPLSAAFPAMLDEQFNALKDSITEIGVQDPITIYEGMVIDGWHRYTAAQEVGVQCPTVELGDVDPQTFVIAKNKARRHITGSQLAQAVVAVYQWHPANITKRGEPGSPLTKTNEELASIAGTSTRTIQQAKKVESKASPEVKAAVKSGEMSVKKAAETVNPPKAPLAANDDQRDELSEAADAIVELAEENETLRAQIAVGQMDAPEVERISAAELIADLRAQVKTLEAELNAMRISRDTFQRENRELMKQLGMNAKELKRLRAA
jgi:ParB-like chromosome segregation protein Spo0J